MLTTTTSMGRSQPSSTDRIESLKRVHGSCIIARSGGTRSEKRRQELVATVTSLPNSVLNA